MIIELSVVLLISSLPELTEEQIANYDKYVDAARCQACEELITFVESKMNKTRKGSKLKELDAIEFLEQACQGKATKSVHYCEEGVDKFGDEITEYIKKNEYNKEFKDKTCTSQCEIKTEMKAKLDGMNDDFDEQVASEMGQLLWDTAIKLLSEYWIYFLLGITSLVYINVWLIRSLEKMRQQSAKMD
eukprot:TRINITY_DN20821_c0_g1_i1.p1 TRINITY_DN20821_c0_g1~~TRINITY_DN20821_c0_g1_i1.p1  ORF type:complete len:203 (+),score=39.91 TRINITY_DN20821_c0_g1_i1:46-609(+)